MPIAVILTVALARASLAAPPDASRLALSDYLHTSWTQHDGVPLGRVAGILQTRDGYLWVVKRDAGLMRFDGMRFVVVPTPCKQPVTIATGTPDGGFWAVCGDQLIRRTGDGRFVEAAQGFLRPASNLHLVVDGDGRAWLFGEAIQSVEADGTGHRQWGRPIRGAIRSAAFDSEGTMWLTDSRQVVHSNGDRTATIALPSTWCLTAARDGGVFAMAGDRVWRLRRGSAPESVGESGVRLNGRHGCLTEARDGGLWIATTQHGVALLHNGRVETFPAAAQQVRMVETVFIDREGTVWAGATTGLHRFRKPLVHRMASLSEHLYAAPAFVFVDSQDNLWVSPGRDGGASRRDARGTWTSVPHQGHPYWAIGEDETGRIWLSDTRDIGYVAGGRFIAVPDASNSRIEDVLSFKRDSRGMLWALSTGVGLYRVGSEPQLVFKSARAARDFVMSERSGVWMGTASGGVEQHVDGRVAEFKNDIFSGADAVPRTVSEINDAIWIATRRSLARLRNGIWTTWTAAHGLPDDGAIADIIPDRNGHLWLTSARGLTIVPYAQLDATPDGMPRTLSFARIGALDGVVSAGATGPKPRSVADSTGRLYFAVFDAIVTADTSPLTGAWQPPSIVLESALFDERAADLAALSRPVEPSRVQFEYTSLSLRSPEHARFRYRLEGYDQDWVDAGSQRRATYGTLPPGSYRFRVIGANSEGVWNEEGASFTFQVVPEFWRTWWFRTTGITLAVLLVITAHRLRLNRLQREFARQVAIQVGERTRIARELHDTFLQTVQGSKMVADHALRNVADQAATVRALEQLSIWLSQATHEGRAALESVRSATDEPADLAEAFREAAKKFRGSCRADLTIAVDGKPRRLQPDAAGDVYRIGYEALRNACAHSGATRIQLLLRYSHDLTVSVVDDGAGMEPAVIAAGRGGHFGLQGMHERAARVGAKLTIASAPGSGTDVSLVVPGLTIYAKQGARQGRWLFVSRR